MTSSASSATWLPAAIARAAIVPPAPAPAKGRHIAPELSGTVRFAAREDHIRSGRHAESEWSREMHDPQRDEVDAFDWLGFGQD